MDHRARMAWRRILLFVVLLAVIAGFANATVPREQGPAVLPPEPRAVPVTPPGDVVAARLPSRHDVRARVGDVVRIEVGHDAEDVVQVLTLGVAEPVEPGLAAELVFDADRAGRFAVTLRDAGKRIGTVDVREAG
jgi:hypothetical protein